MSQATDILENTEILSVPVVDSAFAELPPTLNTSLDNDWIDTDEIIKKWNPMGIRLGLKTPYVSNDRDFLALIRVNPYVSHYTMASRENQYALGSFAFNNTRTVIHAPVSVNPVGTSTDITNSPLTITQHDLPPLLSTKAMTNRFWRGSIEYHLRAISEFTVQGYIGLVPLYQIPNPPSIYNCFTTAPIIKMPDHSYRTYQSNSYIRSDLSIYRHMQCSVPYNYPTKWFDQYKWFNSRIGEPDNSWMAFTTDPHPVVPPFFEDASENFIGLFVRGSVASSGTNAEIFFELEYRAGPDFEFCDPSPIPEMCLKPTRSVPASEFPVYSIPSTQGTSNGWDHFSFTYPPVTNLKRGSENPSSESVSVSTFRKAFERPFPSQ